MVLSSAPAPLLHPPPSGHRRGGARRLRAKPPPSPTPAPRRGSARGPPRARARPPRARECGRSPGAAAARRHCTREGSRPDAPWRSVSPSFSGRASAAPEPVAARRRAPTRTPTDTSPPPALRAPVPVPVAVPVPAVEPRAQGPSPSPLRRSSRWPWLPSKTEAPEREARETVAAVCGSPRSLSPPPGSWDTGAGTSATSSLKTLTTVKPPNRIARRQMGREERRSLGFEGRGRRERAGGWRRPLAGPGVSRGTPLNPERTAETGLKTIDAARSARVHSPWRRRRGLRAPGRALRALRLSRDHHLGIPTAAPARPPRRPACGEDGHSARDPLPGTPTVRGSGARPPRLPGAPARGVGPDGRAGGRKAPDPITSSNPPNVRTQGPADVFLVVF